MHILSSDGDYYYLDLMFFSSYSIICLDLLRE